MILFAISFSDFSFKDTIDIFLKFMQLAKLWINWVLGLCKKSLLDIALVLTCLCPRGWGYLRLNGGKLEPISSSLLLFIYFYFLLIFSGTICEFLLCYKICLMFCIFDMVRPLLFAVPKVYQQELRPCMEVNIYIWKKKFYLL